MLLEEYGLIFIYVKGGKNVIANALSRLDMEAYLRNTISQEESNKELSYIITEDMEIEEFLILSERISKN